MKILNFNVDPALDDYVFQSNKPVTVFCGNDSDLHLSLLGVLFGNYSQADIIQKSNSPLFILHGDVVIDDKDYAVCYIYNKTEPHRVGVNFFENSIHCSAEDTKEYKEKVLRRGLGDGNIFTFKPCTKNTLPESKHRLLQFAGFYADAVAGTQNGDDRPLFVYDLFDHIDESEDLTPWLNDLAALGRQVFIAVGKNYPTEKLVHSSVQLIKVNNKKENHYAE